MEQSTFCQRSLLSLRDIIIIIHIQYTTTLSTSLGKSTAFRCAYQGSHDIRTAPLNTIDQQTGQSKFSNPFCAVHTSISSETNTMAQKLLMGVLNHHSNPLPTLRNVMSKPLLQDFGLNVPEGIPALLEFSKLYGKTESLEDTHDQKILGTPFRRRTRDSSYSGNLRTALDSRFSFSRIIYIAAYRS